MSISASQCSRSCSESGWTVYLDESSSSGEKRKGVGGRNEEKYMSKGSTGEEEGEENLSMISDASSGPPYCELEDCSNGRELDSAGSKKKKRKAGEAGRKDRNPYEDTATSFMMSCSTKKKQGSLGKQGSKGQADSSSYGKSYSKPAQNGSNSAMLKCADVVFIRYASFNTHTCTFSLLVLFSHTKFLEKDIYDGFYCIQQEQGLYSKSCHFSATKECTHETPSTPTFQLAYPPLL